MHEDKYKLDVQCKNCDYNGEIEIKTGTRAEDTECPKCKLRELERKIEPQQISREDINYE